MFDKSNHLVILPNRTFIKYGESIEKWMYDTTYKKIESKSKKKNDKNKNK
jgi:hypothetical protein